MTDLKRKRYVRTCVLNVKQQRKVDTYRLLIDNTLFISCSVKIALIFTYTHVTFTTQTKFKWLSKQRDNDDVLMWKIGKYPYNEKALVKPIKSELNCFKFVSFIQLTGLFRK